MLTDGSIIFLQASRSGNLRSSEPGYILKSRDKHRPLDQIQKNAAL
ncbi:hypothetical protein X474_14255 [Dethiosulfatarculus sandiegensis]|uniref:Uncharacterized protein n=1 Tax=Dethiosulfatarculus sandiegensis TaxID=1429043 RepID=A0A0D2J5M3_9BACT|nr:hypothetical protein X474_14255 [Dethiosulfatarculus sandiegensis]